jgi:hypothetical protein
VNSALRQFPVVGSDISMNVHQLSAGGTLGPCLGLIWLMYGVLRLSRSAQVMMARVWDIERDDVPGFWLWLPRAAGFLLVIGVGFIGAGALAGCTLCRFHLDGIAVCRRPTGCPSAETPLESLRHVRHRARSHLVAGARSHHLCLWGRAQLGGESEPLAAIPSPGPR